MIDGGPDTRVMSWYSVLTTVLDMTGKTHHDSLPHIAIQVVLTISTIVEKENDLFTTSSMN